MNNIIIYGYLVESNNNTLIKGRMKYIESNSGGEKS
jgi:hypothetical protein